MFIHIYAQEGILYISNRSNPKHKRDILEGASSFEFFETMFRPIRLAGPFLENENECE